MCSAVDPYYMKLMPFRLQQSAGYADVIEEALKRIEQVLFRSCSVPDQGDGLIMQVGEEPVNGYVVLF